MQPKRHFYLIKLQYLGFRYHGWQKQPQLKTVERMVERTASYVLRKLMNREEMFKILAAGRTDAMVSVNQTYIQIFIEKEPLNKEEFFPLFYQNLLHDILIYDIIIRRYVLYIFYI